MQEAASIEDICITWSTSLFRFVPRYDGVGKLRLDRTRPSVAKVKDQTPDIVLIGERQFAADGLEPRSKTSKADLEPFEHIQYLRRLRLVLQKFEAVVH